MIFAAGVFSESLGFDVGVFSAIGTLLAMIGGGFAWIIKMLKEQKQTRAEEIENVVSKLINASPEKIVVSPQPMIVELKREFCLRTDIDRDFDEVRRRLTVLEGHRESDKKELSDKIDAIPARVIALLRDVKRIVE